MSECAITYGSHDGKCILSGYHGKKGIQFGILTERSFNLGCHDRNAIQSEML